MRQHRGGHGAGRRVAGRRSIVSAVGRDIGVQRASPQVPSSFQTGRAPGLFHYSTRVNKTALAGSEADMTPTPIASFILAIESWDAPVPSLSLHALEWLGRFHVLTVHFPIALLTAASVAEGWLVL